MNVGATIDTDTIEPLERRNIARKDFDSDEPIEVIEECVRQMDIIRIIFSVIYNLTFSFLLACIGRTINVLNDGISDDMKEEEKENFYCGITKEGHDVLLIAYESMERAKTAINACCIQFYLLVLLISAFPLRMGLGWLYCIPLPVLTIMFSLLFNKCKTKPQWVANKVYSYINFLHELISNASNGTLHPTGGEDEKYFFCKLYCKYKLLICEKARIWNAVFSTLIVASPIIAIMFSY